MVSMDPFPPDVESPHSGGTPLEKQSSSWHKEHTSDASSTDCETIKIINGEASIQIPSAILADPNLLWKSFVVGYFIGDAPHIGSVHATINHLWSPPGSKQKIDVNFIDKNMVLFRVETPQIRMRVL